MGTDFWGDFVERAKDRIVKIETEDQVVEIEKARIEWLLCRLKEL